MSPSQVAGGSELEFFGVKLKVNNPRLAALLNSDVTEDVVVIGRRAREALSGAADDRAEREVAQREVAERVQHADDSVCIRSDELRGA